MQTVLVLIFFFLIRNNAPQNFSVLDQVIQKPCGCAIYYPHSLLYYPCSLLLGFVDVACRWLLWSYALINVLSWLEWFCFHVFALLPFYFRLKYRNYKRYVVWCRGLKFLRLLCHVSCFQCGKAVRMGSVFCPTAVTHPGMLCGHKETVFTNFRAPSCLISIIFSQK